jgi:hypothetical protein
VEPAPVHRRVEILERGGVRVLDGEVCEIEGVGIAGVKGFAGGFGRGSLGAWGEPAVKAFVREALNEAMKLEAALAKLRTPRRIALLHYSPVTGTVAGEPVEIFPFLGSSRLEEPLLRYPVDAVFHGHAHRGTMEAKTINGVPVYNVAKPLLQRSRPDRPPFQLFELPRTGWREAFAGRGGFPRSLRRTGGEVRRRWNFRRSVQLVFMQGGAPCVPYHRKEPS